MARAKDSCLGETDETPPSREGQKNFRFPSVPLCGVMWWGGAGEGGMEDDPCRGHWGLVKVWESG